VKLFIYEHITGGGLLTSRDALPPSFLREGKAMVEDVASDFSQLVNLDVTILCEPRVALQAPKCHMVYVDTADSASGEFDRLAAEADWSLVIAPELGGSLFNRCRRVDEVGGKLLGPSPNVVKRCSNKQATADDLAAAGVPTPRGRLLASGEQLPANLTFPAVIKPNDGCGSQDVRLIRNADEASQIGALPWPARLEQFCPGIAASVAVLCGPNGLHPLPPCYQRLSDGGRFQYLGGALPLPMELARRATELALRAVGTLPEPRGYVGVDVVLGDSSRNAPLAIAESGGAVAHDRLWHTECADYFAADCVIEINPRLTTSYVGLRAACRTNLAEAMLRIVDGEPAELSFWDDPLQFDADGTVRFSDEPWA
jgi:predicted ATP-grasp superfamily ATP-dependent carboligase